MAQKRRSGTKVPKQQRLRRRRPAAQRYYDYNLLASVILLTCFGLVMLYSTSAYEAQVEHGSDMFYFGKQAAISAACLVAVLIFSQVDYHIYAKFATILYVVSNILLVATKFIGREINGAKRWIYFGPISFQPAELGKLSLILFLACVIVKIGGRKMRGWRAPGMILGLGGITAFFTYFFTQNMSTAIIMAGITGVMLFVAHPKTVPFLAAVGAVLAMAAGVVFYVATNAASGTFRLRRVLVWLDPEAYASWGGYQVMQGLYAIGSGGFFGKGLGNSTQKLGAVPEAQNDMIFSIVCEELGVFGAAMLTILFVFLLYRLLFIAQNAPDLLGSLIATGIFAHIALQVVLNMAVVLNMIPTTGVTLPFVSYGGTSILFLMAEMTLALSVSRQIKFKEQEERKRTVTRPA